MSNKAPAFSVDLGDDDPLAVEGWAAIDSLLDDAQKGRTFEAQLDHASMYRQLFSSTVGRYVLNDLIDCFFKQDIVDGNDLPGSLLPGIRQGQAHVVKRIFHMIDFANSGGGKPTGPGVQREE